MKQSKRWIMVIGLIIVGSITAVLYTNLALRDGGNMFNMILLFVLLSSIIFRGIVYFSFNPKQQYQKNIISIAFYYITFVVAFTLVAYNLNEPSAEALNIAFVMLLLGSIHALNSLHEVFQRGWGTFFTLMIIPLLLIMWLVMFGITDGSAIERYEVYAYLQLSGILYWGLVSAVIWGFSNRILKSLNHQTK